MESDCLSGWMEEIINLKHMRKIILLIIAFIPLIAFCQSGGTRSLKTKSAKIVHSDITGDNNVLIRIDSNGNEHKTFIDNNTLYLDGDTLKSLGQQDWNLSVQSFSGTSISWNVQNGQNATITLSGNTTITLSSLIAGMEGSITITNSSTAYSLSFAGYTNKIHDSVYSSANTVQTSGSGRIDSYSWRYDGTYVIWNGGKYYH